MIPPCSDHCCVIPSIKHRQPDENPSSDISSASEQRGSSINSLAPLFIFCQVKSIANAVQMRIKGNITMKNVGFVGWRGMVGSVLMQRMTEERDFDGIRPVFSQPRRAAGKRRHSAGTAARYRTHLILMHCARSTLLSAARAAITPMMSIRSCVRAAGTATGLMRHQHCG